MNLLKLNQRDTIISLWKRGWSARRIARELGLDRDTANKYIRLEVAAKAATPTPGNESGDEASGEGKPATLTTGVESKPATPTAGNEKDPVRTAIEAARANVSLCEAWKTVIEAGLDQGLSAKRIHEDLVREHGFGGGYESVKRFVRRLETAAPVPYRRMEFAAGEQLQVDFGTGPWIIGEDGKKRRPHLFRAVLCCSRKGYSEATFDQKTETFLRCLENSYRHFGGVTVTTAPDNLKAAVLHPDWYDPEINPKLAAFAEHYGTVILPTKPGVPRHKGRVERGVAYVQDAVKGRSFASLGALNRFLAEWEANVADNRIHGTTRRHVEQHFLASPKSRSTTWPRQCF